MILLIAEGFVEKKVPFLFAHFTHTDGTVLQMRGRKARLVFLSR